MKAYHKGLTLGHSSLAELCELYRRETETEMKGNLTPQ